MSRGDARQVALILGGDHGGSGRRSGASRAAHERIPVMAGRELRSEGEAGLKKRGLDAVRILIVTAGPGTGAAVHGLDTSDG
jgi:hypothetical protein